MIKKQKLVGYIFEKYGRWCFYFVLFVFVLFVLNRCQIRVKGNEEKYDNPPIGYIILTDEGEYTWQLEDHISLFVYDTKERAIEAAWGYYDYTKKRKEREWKEIED